MKLNRKTARARKTHSVVHLVQLRQKVHRPVLSPLVVARREAQRFSTTSEISRILRAAGKFNAI